MTVKPSFFDVVSKPSTRIKSQKCLQCCGKSFAVCGFRKMGSDCPSQVSNCDQTLHRLVKAHVLMREVGRRGRSLQLQRSSGWVRELL